MLCKHCMRPLVGAHWIDGYCSRDCHRRHEDYDPEAHDNMPHPNDRSAMRRELRQSADLFDAMTQAAAIDHRLPKIIYMRRKGWTLRAVGASLGLSHVGVTKIILKLPPNLLSICGLR